MYLDIAVGVIIILTMVFGFRKGFVFTFIHTVDWILAIVAAFIWSPKLETYLLEKTKIYEWLFTKIDGKFSESLGNATISYNSLPKVLEESLSSLTTTISENLAEKLSDFLFSIVCFILIVLAVKLVLWLILGMLSKKHNDGFTGAIDGLLGLVAGFVKGFIIVSVLLAIMLPLINLLSPEHIESVTEMLSESTIAGEIYDNNIILMIIRDFIA